MIKVTKYADVETGLLEVERRALEQVLGDSPFAELSI